MALPKPKGVGDNPVGFGGGFGGRGDEMRSWRASVRCAVIVVVGGVLSSGPAAGVTPAQRVFDAVGTHTWTVPKGVTSVTITAMGAQGGTAAPHPNGGSGGLGGRAVAVIPVTPGEQLQINVGGVGGNAPEASNQPGGAGGFNGGGSGGQGFWAAAGGGGASDVRRGAFGLASRLVVGAGGGGGGAGNPALTGGAGGGAEGGPGASVANGAAPGSPGTQTAGGGGGAAGAGPGSYAAGMGGGSGTGGNGGGSTGYGGGGGGGGWFGGGGGGGAGAYGGGAGGGGSSYGPAGAALTSGVRSGDGRVLMTYARSDAHIRRSADASFVGGDIYNTTGASQSKAWSARRGQTRVFFARVENDGNLARDVRVNGPASTSAFGVKYLYDGTNVTTKVTGSGLTLQSVPLAGLRLLRIEITVKDAAPIGATRNVKLVVTSGTTADAVVASLKAVK